uniref:(northern house mosquito) hypothetical protein n=1 Tax=Culex pipiens TaxID=7175 RepID=A0A8D8IY16_CULPI
MARTIRTGRRKDSSPTSTASTTTSTVTTTATAYRNATTTTITTTTTRTMLGSSRRRMPSRRTSRSTRCSSTRCPGSDWRRPMARKSWTTRRTNRPTCRRPRSAPR